MPAFELQLGGERGDFEDPYYTRGDSLKTAQVTGELNAGRYSYTARIVNGWNGLLEEVFTTPTIGSFKARCDNEVAFRM